MELYSFLELLILNNVIVIIAVVNIYLQSVLSTYVFYFI